MRKLNLFIIVILIISALLYAEKSYCTSSIAKIIKIEGPVFVINESGTKKNASINMLLYGEDTIKTGDNGICHVEYSDQTILRILQESEVKINEVTDDDDDVNSITCILGSIFAKIFKTSANKNKYQVMTPTAVVGVRGTDFMVSTGEDGASHIGVEEGEVEVENENDQNVKLQKNEQLDVNYKSEMKKAANFQYKNFNRKQWMEKRKNFFANNKTQILDHYEKRFTKMDTKQNAIQNNLQKLSLERKQLITGLTKARKNKNTPAIQQYKTKLQNNYSKYFKNMKQARKLDNKFTGNSHMLQRLNKSPKFAKENATRLKALNIKKDKYSNKMKNNKQNRRKSYNEYKKHNLIKKLEKQSGKVKDVKGMKKKLGSEIKKGKKKTSNKPNKKLK